MIRCLVGVWAALFSALVSLTLFWGFRGDHAADPGGHDRPMRVITMRVIRLLTIGRNPQRGR